MKTMKQYLIPVIVVICVIASTFLYTKYHIDKQHKVRQIENANIVGEKRYLESLVYSMINDMNQSLPSCTSLRRGQDSLTLAQAVSFPCLLIYIPEADNVCMSCVDYAISSVKKVFSDFEKRTDIGIISQAYNPDLKERIINKKVYFLQDKRALISVYNEFNNPLYLVINKEYQVVSSFVPNANFDNLTRSYLSKVEAALVE